MSIGFIPSIEAASIVLLDALNKNEATIIKEVMDYVQNNECIGGTADSFHNAATNLARAEAYSCAVAFLEVGHKRYSRDTDILADLIHYGSQCKRIEDIYPYFLELKSVRQRFWTWRAYTFSCDYLMEYIQYTTTDEEENTIEKEILCLLESYKRNYPNDERPFVEESEYYERKHDSERQVAALIEGMDKIAICCQCALKYADYMFKKGEYEKVIPAAEKAVNIREDQPSISLGYTYYILAMSREVVMRKNNMQFTEAVLKPVYDAYGISFNFLEKEGGRSRLQLQIWNRVKALERESKIESNIDFIQ
jgi:hypothetical protein